MSHGQGEGPDGDQWSQTTQDTLGGAGVSAANGVLRNRSASSHHTRGYHIFKEVGRDNMPPVHLNAPKCAYSRATR